MNKFAAQGWSKRGRGAGQQWYLIGHPRYHPQIIDKWMGILNSGFKFRFRKRFFSDTTVTYTFCVNEYV